MVGTGLAVYVVAALLRAPRVIAARRFWAEDGSVFFEYAWNHGPLDSLLSSDFGYFLFLPNLAGLLAVQLPLEWAPLMVIAIALLVQVLPGILVALSEIPALAMGWRYLLALGLILFSPISDEAHLNTATSQFHLMISSGLILAFPVGRAATERFKLGVLCLGGLTGIATLLLTPLFWLRAGIAARTNSDDRRYRGLQAGVLTLAVLVQAAAISGSAPDSNRKFGGDPGSLISYLGVSHLALPLLGEAQATRIAKRSVSTLAGGSLPVPLVFLTFVAGVAIFVAVWRSGSRAAAWLVAAAAITGIGSYLGALGTKFDLIEPYFAHRYVFGPTALLMLGLLAAAGPEGRLGRAARTAILLICMWVVMLGANQFFDIRKRSSVGPDWTEQVAVWRTDPTRSLKIWPGGWKVELPQKTSD